MTNFKQLIGLLMDAGVEFILVGGLAARAHGSARLAEYMDVVYNRAPRNIARLTEALRPISPYLRGAPTGLPFQWDHRTITRGLNFTLTTTLGEIDLLGEITGGGQYSDLLPHSVEIDLYQGKCLCLGLERLIHVKRAGGRPRDLDAIAELETIREERDKFT